MVIIALFIILKFTYIIFYSLEVYGIRVLGDLLWNSDVLQNMIRY